MADIIKSSEIGGLPLMNHFKGAVEQINREHGHGIASPLTITLGDEFQGVVKNLQSALKIIFKIDELLLNADPEYRLRFVVNYGQIDTPVNQFNAYEMLGDGLTRARHLLSELKSEDTEILLEGIGENQRSLNMALRLYRSFYNDWKGSDRPIAASFLSVEDYKEVAKIYSKDPSSMWRREKSLKMDEFKISRELIMQLSE